jgi:phytoene synthase
MNEKPDAGSSFSLAMRILPVEQRDAILSVYGFCRAVDDIADEPIFSSTEDRLSALDQWREDLRAIFRGGANPELDDLSYAIRRFGLRLRDFEAVIDGVAMDAEQIVRAPDWALLDLYCDRVASAVGRLSVRIFGLDEEPGEALAFHLGRALQLTNILRDVDEDAIMGRLYIPREALAAAGIATTDPLEAAGDPRLPAACSEVAERAREHFARSDAVLDREPRQLVRAPRLMSAAYRSVLDRMTARGFSLSGGRATPNKMRVLGALLWYGVL